MSALIIRELDDDLASRLEQRASTHGHSMEEEARAILQDALGDRPSRTGRDLAEAIRREFAPLGGVELEIPTREFDRDPPRFE